MVSISCLWLKPDSRSGKYLPAADANIIDCDPDKLQIGDKVEVVFEKVSDTLAVPRFRPI